MCAVQKSIMQKNAVSKVKSPEGALFSSSETYV